MNLLSNSQRRGLIYLLPLCLVVVMLAVLEDIFESRSLDADVQSNEQVELAKQRSIAVRIDTSASSSEGVGGAGADTPAASGRSTQGAEPSLKPFNPNRDSFEQMRLAGVPTEVAAGVVRWRSYGKRYRIVEDLALVSGVDDSLYARLKPFVVIDQEYRPAPREVVERGRESEYAQKSGGFSRKSAASLSEAEQGTGAKVEAKAKARLADNPTLKEGAEAALSEVEDSSLPRLKSGVSSRIVELNSATKEELVALNGIGEKSASEIIKYRELLGGYHSVEQILELKVIFEDNFLKFSQQIWCDSCNISKIDINFAHPKELMSHPYMSAKTLRRIVKQRQLKGGWSRIEEMIEQEILDKEEAKRLSPYLRFRSQTTE